MDMLQQSLGVIKILKLKHEVNVALLFWSDTLSDGSPVWGGAFMKEDGSFIEEFTGLFEFQQVMKKYIKGV